MDISGRNGTTARILIRLRVHSELGPLGTSAFHTIESETINTVGSSLAAHAAAREADVDSAARFAARAAGQALGTAHVANHAIGAAWYGAKAADAARSSGERDWLYRRLSENLRLFILHLARERSAFANVLQYPGMQA